MMAEDLGVEAKEAAVREVAKLLPLPELLQSIASIKADYIARQQASNILLDEKFVAKVSDFGLAKPEDRSKLESHVSTNVKGTFVYFDPYHFSTHKLTRKSDTYVFGVVMLEVLKRSGRPTMDQKVGEDECSLIKWAWNIINKREVDQILDSSLIGDISPNNLGVFVLVDERCCMMDPKKRPTMAQVVLQLDVALEQESREFVIPNQKISSSVSNLLWSLQRSVSDFEYDSDEGKKDVESEEGVKDVDRNEWKKNMDGRSLEDEDSAVEPAEEARLSVGNLPYQVDNEELGEVFDVAGLVQTAEEEENDMDGGSFEDEDSAVGPAEEARLFVGNLPYQVDNVVLGEVFDVAGRQLNVKKATPKVRIPRPCDASFWSYVGNLPWVVDGDRLKEFFSQHWRVLDASVAYDRGQSCGFGFVSMSTVSELNNVINALDRQVLDCKLVPLSQSFLLLRHRSRELSIYSYNFIHHCNDEKGERIQKSLSKNCPLGALTALLSSDTVHIETKPKARDCPLSISDFEYDSDEGKKDVESDEGVKDVASDEGENDMDCGSFSDEDSAVEPAEEARLFVGNLPYQVDHEELGEVFDEAGLATPKVRIPRPCVASFWAYVGNLPWEVDGARLKEFFSQHWRILDASVAYDRGLSRGFGFVSMSTVSELNNAVNALDRQFLDSDF
ncbi:hypothetical protein BUALT_Bualt05G0142400 [Buddleja alternifolia]|uniref:Uncharacterized protein n=1 Tax=Buddleja alternifolia TaxID=168488 RepID=A0AAV6XUV3_9LAMI|nr:hypothetical protein BUALT_Bualt05G0142400 [Buddleja alternifolia]